MGEQASTLRMLTAPKPAPFRCGSFVRVKARRPYRNALGLVKKVDAEASQVYVVVTAQRRAQKRQQDDSGLFKDEEYATLVLPMNQVRQREPAAPREELEIFLRSGKAWVRAAARRAHVTLRVHDKVEMAAGSLQGLECYVTEIDANGIVKLRVENLLEEIVVHEMEVARRFECGEYVRVVTGRHSGVEGFIVLIQFDGIIKVYPVKGPQRSTEEVCEGCSNPCSHFHSLF